ncbi:MAG: NAD(P)-binding protein [Firmicutes bacterium]|nr:NAD(P)-binding protein [Bacillota bacterium]
MPQKQEINEIVIIGAGIAGLATGCYARMNGYRTHIFERHNLPGPGRARASSSTVACITWPVLLLLQDSTGSGRNSARPPAGRSSVTRNSPE